MFVKNKDMDIQEEVNLSDQLFCECIIPDLYPRNLCDGGYSWCKCGKMIGSK